MIVRVYGRDGRFETERQLETVRREDARAEAGLMAPKVAWSSGEFNDPIVQLVSDPFDG